MRYFKLFLFGIYLCFQHSCVANSQNNTTPFVPTSHPPSLKTTAKSSNKTEPTTAFYCGQLSNLSCKACVEKSECFWCDSASTCMTYEKTLKILPDGCKDNNWYWKQCVINGHVLMILVPSLVGGFLLFFCCGIYCCCCRSSRKRSQRREDDSYHRRREEIRMRSEERRNQRQSRYDLIRKKYGLLENEDDDDDDEPLEDPRTARVI